MTTATRTRRSAKPARSMRLYPGTPALLEMMIGSQEFSYWLLPQQDGLTFELRKLLGDGGDVYRVRLDGKRTSCSCKGFQGWRHCKHVDALTTLQGKGRLPRLAKKAAPAVELEDL